MIVEKITLSYHPIVLLHVVNKALDHALVLTIHLSDDTAGLFFYKFDSLFKDYCLHILELLFKANLGLLHLLVYNHCDLVLNLATRLTKHIAETTDTSTAGAAAHTRDATHHATHTRHAGHP